MEKGILARALNYNWPPNSWRGMTLAQVIRLYAVEAEVAKLQASPSSTTDTAESAPDEE